MQIAETVQAPYLASRQRLERWSIDVRGIVQGVGFRPFIYGLARQCGISGTVYNDEQGVLIEAEGPLDHLHRFLAGIQRDAPPLSFIEEIDWKPIATRGDTEFCIGKSRSRGDRRTLISPDVATCDACLTEMLDRSDRRYRYPFINCTNCGPRFTITLAVPYDRASTTMCGFPLCDACRHEYEDPGDRRFHAQPNACPACGPRTRLVRRDGSEVDDADQFTDPIHHAAHLLGHGAIVALKGLGGYHLACNPTNRVAVATLRQRKGRWDKPFALMVRTVDEAAALCQIGEEEVRWLTSPARPIVLLDRRAGTNLTSEVAPRQRTLGVMLAYTPIHHLLLADSGMPLVMTSGNRTDEPIAYRDEEALQQLGDIADYFLVHDRPIHMRCDDSVVSVRGGGLYPTRRSRGYAPAPLSVAQRFGEHTLACGGELKNTFCLGRDHHAFVSHHIGDLENYETLHSFREGIDHYCRLFDIRPTLVAHDLHPEYLSTKYAQELEEGVRSVGIQHHHAHIASCIADNELPDDERVIGVAMDGTGLGTDGAIWGGEFLEGSIAAGFTRRGHLEYVPMPGGEAAIRQPWRMAVAYLLTLYGEDDVLDLPLDVVRRAGESHVHLLAQILRAGGDARWLAPPTSSAGRLFDAISALCCLPGTDRTTYEGQAAVELELAASGRSALPYPFTVEETAGCGVVRTREIIAAVVADLIRGRPQDEISDAFHCTMAEVVVACCVRSREETDVRSVALTGGTFQNSLLLTHTMALLLESGFTVYRHRRVPPNDAGLSLGQVVLAARGATQETAREVGTTCV